MTDSTYRSISYLLSCAVVIGLGWLYGRFGVLHPVDFTFFIAAALFIAIGVFIVFVRSFRGSIPSWHLTGFICGLSVMWIGHQTAYDRTVRQVFERVTSDEKNEHPEDWKQSAPREVFANAIRKKTGDESLAGGLRSFWKYKAATGIRMRRIYSSRSEIETGFRVWATWAYQGCLIFGGALWGARTASKINLDHHASALDGHDDQETRGPPVRQN